MDDQTLLRYSRQIMLPQVGIEGQQRLRDSRVLIIGVGGLGSPAAMYLAAAGIGTLELADDDSVDLSNLQRQIAHTTERIGLRKTASAEQTLRALNPETTVVCRDERLQGEALDHAVGRADLVLDCSDNFATRFAVNSACQRLRRPLVWGAAIGWNGQVGVFDLRDGGPCYRCLYPEEGDEDLRCSENGVIAPLVGVIGASQALEAVKLLCGIGEPLSGRLLRLDGLRMHWRELRLRADPACPVCAA
ncbi:MAG: molybdopterin-synthase adenylyltransferase MoeB [Gammaproteobacteria bacterium]|nr:molybdopterin-synthase adenylyltransferase MoeB [Gammaproteobacteria bacterium]